MAVIRNLVVKIGADISGLSKNLKSAQQQLMKVSKEIGKIGRSLTLSITTPLLSLAAVAVKTSSDMEESMSKIAKSFQGTREEIDGLSDVAKKMSISTIYNIDKVADSMRKLSKAGFSVAEMEKSLSTLTNLATASDSDLEVATSNVLEVMNQFNMSSDDTNTVANVMAATLSQTSLSLDELTLALNLVGKTASGVGYTIEDTSSAIAILSNAGFSAQEAGTYLKKILEGLQNPTSQMKNIFEELGLTLDEINPATNSLSSILKKFTEANIKSTDATRLFGEGIDAAFITLVSNGSDKLEEITKSITDTNAAEEEASKKLKSLSNQLKLIKSQLSQIAETLGNILLPIIQKFLSSLGPLIDKLSNIKESTMTLIVKIGAIAAAIGPVISLIAKIIKGFSTLSGLFSALSSPVGIAIVAIAAFIAKMVALYNTNEDFRKKVQEVWKAIKTVVTKVIADIKAWWDEYGQAILDSVKKVLNTIWTIFGALMTSVMNGILKLVEYIGPIWEQLKKIFMTLWDTICELYELLKPVFDAIGSVILTLYAVSSGVIEGIISALGPLIQAVLNVMQIIADVVGFIVDLFRGDFTGAFEHIKSVGSSFGDFFSNLWQGILNIGKGFVNGFINMFNSLGVDIVGILSNVFGKIGDFFSNLWSGITNVTSNIWNAIVSVFGNIGSWFQNLFSEAFNWGKNLINMIGNGIKSAWNSIKNACSSVIGTIKGWLGFGSPTKEGPGRYSDKWAPNLMSMYTEGIEAGVPDVRNAVEEVAEALTSINGENINTNVNSGDTSIGADVLNGLLSAMKVGGGVNTPTTNQNVELSIDGSVFARLIYPSLMKEFKRNGVLIKEGGF